MMLADRRDIDECGIQSEARVYVKLATLADPQRTFTQ